MIDIKRFREDLNMGQKMFGDRWGISQSQVSKFENGKEPIPDTLISKLKDVFEKESLDEYFIDDDVFKMQSIQNSDDDGLPLIPFEFIAGYGEDNFGIKLDECTIYRIPEFRNIGAEFLVRVNGNSMYPKYSSGDILACRKVHDITFFQWGKIYVIDSPQGQIVKRVCEHDNKDLIWLVSDNREKLFEDKDKYAPFSIRKDEIRSLSIVVGAVRME